MRKLPPVSRTEGKEVTVGVETSTGPRRRGSEHGVLKQDDKPSSPVRGLEVQALRQWLY